MTAPAGAQQAAWPAVGLCLLLAMAAAAGATGDTRVADAAMRGDREAVRALLTQAADVNGAQGDGMTALHWAAVTGEVDTARMLVVAGANVKATTRLGSMTPLWMAAQAGHAAIADLLLRAGANADAATTLGVTPMMIATAAGSVETIGTLAARGADVNAREQTYGQTPLMFAAAGDHARAIEALVEAGADVHIATTIRAQGRGGRGGAAGRGRQGGTAGRGGRGGRGEASGAGTGTPAEQSDTAQTRAPASQAVPAAPAIADAPDRTIPPGLPPAQVIAVIVAPPPVPATQAEPGAAEPPRSALEPMGGLTPLHYAVRQGHAGATRALLARGSDVNELTADRTTPLMLAIINGRFDLAMELLERGADPGLATMAGGTPLYRVLDLQWAPKSFYPQPDIRQERVSYLDLMRALLERGADPNARLSRALWYTTYGFDLDALDPAGATPFWRAAQAGDLDAMHLLVAAGADPALSTNDGVTPLLALAGDGFHGNDAIVVPQGRMPATRYLVEVLQADVNARDEAGGAATSILHQNTRAYTPVHAAAARGDNEMIRYLVSKGARVDLIGRNGLTAADMANGPRERIQPFPDTIALLVELGSPFSNRCISC